MLNHNNNNNDKNAINEKQKISIEIGMKPGRQFLSLKHRRRHLRMDFPLIELYVDILVNIY